MLNLLLLILSTDWEFQISEHEKELSPQAIEFVREREEEQLEAQLENRKIELMYKLESPLASEEEKELLRKELSELS